MTNFAKRMVKVAGVVILLVGMAWLARGYMRYGMVRMVLTNPETRARVLVMPGKKKLDETYGGQLVNLGYGDFYAGEEGGEVSVKIRGEAVIGLVVENACFLIKISKPADQLRRWEENRANAEEATKWQPELREYVKKLSVDEVGAILDAEETRPLSFFNLCTMSKGECEVYCRKLLEKTWHMNGWLEVYAFEAPHVIGIAKEGDGAGSRETGTLVMCSPDRSMVVTFDLYMKKGSTVDTAKMLEQIAGSFEFTVKNLGDWEQIKRVITEAGIVEKQQ